MEFTQNQNQRQEGAQLPTEDGLAGNNPHPEVLERAFRLLARPNLLERAAELMTRRGLQGEQHNRLLIFLSAVGGHLLAPIHLVVHGNSSGGKNRLVRAATELLPQERVEFLTGLSEHALVYAGDKIEGVLVIDEAEGGSAAEYTLRIAMSEGRIIRRTVNKKGGNNQGQRLETQISASIITTTTSPRLHAENQTRVFDIWIDESEEQTRAVLQAMAANAAGEARVDSEAELEDWRAALRLLEPADVIIPFAKDLAGGFPAKMLRVRRDFERTLALIGAHSLLHQRQRERDAQGRVVATLDDYGAVYPLLQTVLRQSMSGLTQKAYELCDLHDELAASRSTDWIRRADLEREAMRREIASPNTVRAWAKQLTELGIWQGELRNRAWEHRRIRDARAESVPLPRAEDLPQQTGPPTASQWALGSRTASPHTGFAPPPNGIHGGSPLIGRNPQPISAAEAWEATEDPLSCNDFDLPGGGWEHLVGEERPPSTSEADFSSPADSEVDWEIVESEGFWSVEPEEMSEDVPELFAKSVGLDELEKSWRAAEEAGALPSEPYWPGEQFRYEAEEEVFRGLAA